MSATVQQIKEQVLNLARRPTTFSPAEDTDDDRDEDDDFVDRTPQLRWAAECPKLTVSSVKKIAEKATDRVVLSVAILGFFIFLKPRKAMS
ncbi:hypothetical protein MTR67_035369 [Solanum verrucosum]|uniref:Uncharacterized protein n=1 Tax=Solanum verrucosum TaxID=315347 RepID=A0AAF0UAE6_SOLVR|nr:hypothetical protein MTR67_035369 [Solanum verrucosum]